LDPPPKPHLVDDLGPETRTLGLCGLCSPTTIGMPSS
jgi:hypothetical protein